MLTDPDADHDNQVKMKPSSVVVSVYYRDRLLLLEYIAPLDAPAFNLSLCTFTLLNQGPKRPGVGNCINNKNNLAIIKFFLFIIVLRVIAYFQWIAYNLLEFAKCML